MLVTAVDKRTDSTKAATRVEVRLGSEALKDAVFELWDCQTREEMAPLELDRYVTARKLVRKQRFENAKVVLSSPAPKHAESLNLLGVIYEALGDFNNARQCYGKAASLNGECWAAQMNARRVYELHLFGRSRIPMYL
ncbi:MAG TPA: tetratricopeptide repeat protein [Planctomycetota bacterium]|nr:tetratricopeptide repeat protein [Planctomycetota bacterium]